jgi:hypothetical protein
MHKTEVRGYFVAYSASKVGMFFDQRNLKAITKSLANTTFLLAPFYNML